MDKLMNILINNLTPFNILIESIPAGGLPKNVSDLLNISTYQSIKEVKWNLVRSLNIM